MKLNSRRPVVHESELRQTLTALAGNYVLVGEVHAAPFLFVEPRFHGR